jgi:predicted alpha/beta-hydrolase family hydrolase
MTQKTDLSQFIFLFAHGAGANMDSDWMQLFDQLLSEQGLAVKRFNFPYMIQRIKDGSRRPPDRAPKLLEAFKQQISLLTKDKKIIIGGKSMGGRMASLLGAEGALVSETDKLLSGIVCLGYPFHPPKKLDKYKGAHLADIDIPTLILQGERDTMGTKLEIAGYELSKSVTVRYLGDGDHSFKPRVKSGLTFEINMKEACDEVIRFINQLN